MFGIGKTILRQAFIVIGIVILQFTETYYFGTIVVGMVLDDL